MAVKTKSKIEVISTTGRKITVGTAQKNLKNFQKNLAALPDRTRKSIGRNFPSQIGRQVRAMWKENFISKEAWKTKSAKESYAKSKDRMLARGDTFKLGTFAPTAIIAGSGSFGVRTGLISRNLFTARGSEVKIFFMKTTPSRGSRGFDLNIQIRVKEEEFDAQGDMRYYKGDKARGHRINTRRTANASRPNYLLAFSQIISGAGSDSVLTTLSDFQLRKLRQRIRERLRRDAREIIQSQVMRSI